MPARSAAAPDARRLSKTRFTAGLQCHKQLWWRVHEPDAKELIPDPGQRNIFDQAAEVGRVARRQVPGGELIDLPFYQYDNKVAATRLALHGERPAIYEAAFLSSDTYVQVDILERRAPGFSVIEVKATNSKKKEHIPDAAVQVHVLRQAGVAVDRAELMHLNPECRYPDLDHLFVREDVTREVELYLPLVAPEIAAQLAMLAGPIPDVAIGEHCTKPNPCPFLQRCWPKVPAHHISTLYSIPRRKVEEYEAKGYETIHDIPSDLELGVIHQRQVRAVTTGKMVVETTLGRALEEFTGPLAYLDFETVSLAIPRYDGCRPWENVPVQFSCDLERAGGKLVHHEFLADGPGDPRPALARALVDSCRGARRVVAYYASFERDCVRQLALAVPELELELKEIEARLIDLLPLVRNHVYHPDFGGSFSIKKVLPALVPGLSYGDLTVSDGEKATLELMRLMFHGDKMRGPEQAQLRRDLLAYCHRDTVAMVKLLERLRGLVGAPQLELELF
ncbi:MAG TPA: DUF2779 domain-containing protein [Gemmatimonadales bacterium]|nr:DUF2779 domain-containing protein [Gemmatimonadales bacterium]